MSQGLVNAAYIGAAILFILSLSGLSNQETARRGNLFGIIGMVLAVIVTMTTVTDNLIVLVIVMLIGGGIGLQLAKKVEMTQMPELVAVLHSLVGLAAVLVGFANIGTVSDMGAGHSGEAIIHGIEIFLGIFIGAVTFSGSIAAYLKLSAKVSGRPLQLPGKHWLNLIMVVVSLLLGVAFVQGSLDGGGTFAIIAVTIIALVFGVHLVMAIGGADMPVVVSMLNSYSGWAAAATGFMLQNYLLIIVGALVGSSGAILSYIMCKAMNRQFLSVIAGGFGQAATSTGGAGGEIEGEVTPTSVDEVSQLLLDAKEVMIIPGYGMAVAQAQHIVSDICRTLKEKKINVRFGIHPVAGRMPGHMNVLLAEAKVPYDIVFEMEEINEDFPNVDVSIVIGANDIVNPAAQDVPDSPIAGMPVLEPWLGETTIVLKRSMATGYAGVENPLFFKENTKMLFGDAKESLSAVLKSL